MPSTRRQAIVITGPTGSGKSDLAVAVAERLGGAIISADSRQVYRGMEIGTAKPDPEQRARVPHHGFDLIHPDETYSAGRFARDAWRWIQEEWDRNRVPIICGGTGFFIRALLEPLAPEPAVDPQRRAALRRYLAHQSVPELKRWLRRLDPQRAADLIDEGGSQRLARSLEVTLLSGRPHSWWLSEPPETPPLSALTFCLTWPRRQLYRRIEQRFERMIAEGLLDEARRLRVQYGGRVPGLKAVGYSELIEYLEGAVELDEAVERAKRATRRFARRQLTWFRHQMPEDTFWLDASRPTEQLVDEIVGRWRASTGLAADDRRR